jgi:hypothetical protein
MRMSARIETGPLSQISAAIFFASASATHQAEGEGLLGRDVPPGEQDLGRQGVGDLSPQPHAGSAEGEEPAPGLGDAEDRVLRSHPDVGALEDLGATGHCVALDRRNDRLHRPVVSEKRLPVEVRHLGHQLLELFVPLAAAHGLEVGAGAEDVAATREDRDPQLGILVEQSPGAVHPCQHPTAQGVLRLRAVQGDGQYVAFALDQAMLGIQWRLLGSGISERRTAASLGRARRRVISSRSPGDAACASPP